MFSWLRNLFQKGEDPLETVVHPQLGELRWREADEAWFGTCGSVRFSLAYEGRAAPSERVCAYARKLLETPGWFDTTVAEAKAAACREYGEDYVAEIRALTLGTVHFSAFREPPYIFAQLEGGREFRCWRIEYSGRQCLGIGFDS